MFRRKSLKTGIDPQWLKFQAAFSRESAQGSNSVSWLRITLLCVVLVLLVWRLG